MPVGDRTLFGRALAERLGGALALLLVRVLHPGSVAIAAELTDDAAPTTRKVSR